MPISTDQKVDYLWKKLGYGKSKTDTAANKDAVNESISSPLLLRGENIWAQSNLIPNVIPGGSNSIVTVYPTSSPIECTVDGTASVNRTWKTNIIDWIPPEIGSTYLIKVYIHTSGNSASAASSGTQIFAAGSGNNDEWFFDYQSGTLNFIGSNLPNGINFTGKSVYISGAIYSGIKGTVPPGAGTTLTSADIQFLNVSGIGTIVNLDTTTGTIDFLEGTNISYSGIGTINELDTTTGTIDYLTGTNISYSGIGTINELDTTTGTIDFLEGTNVSYSGIGTIETLDTTTGTIDFLEGTNVSYSGIGTINELDTTTATIDYLTGTNVSYSGISTLITLESTTATITNLEGTNVSYSGIGTIETLDTTTGTIDFLEGTNVSYSGIGTIETLDTTIGTIDYLTGTNVSYSGIGTIETLNTTTATIDSLEGTNVSYSGIGTIETLDTTTGTIDYLTGTNVSYSGIGTIVNLDTTNANIDYLLGTNTNISGISTASKFSTGNAGTGINIDTNTITGPSEIIIDPAGIGDNTGSVRIKGNLLVDGTETTINSTTIELADFNVGIATTVGTNLLLDGAGIGIGSTNIRKTLIYDQSSDSLKSSENFDLESGKVYKINEIEILSSTQLTIENIDASGISTLTTLESTTATVTNLQGTNVSYSGIGTINELDTTTATIDYLTGINVSYSGIGTIETLDTTTGTIDYLTGTNVSYSGIGTLTTLESTTATVTNLEGTNVSYSGIGTIVNLDTTVGTIDFLEGTNVSYSGIGTIVNLDTTVGTIDFLEGTNVSYSGISTLTTLESIKATVTNLEGTNISYSGIGTINELDTTTGTIDYLTGTNISYSGIGTIETLDTTTATIDTLDTTTGTIDYLTGTNVSYSGISTLAVLESTTATITNLEGTNVSYSGIGTIETLDTTTGTIDYLTGTNVSYSGIGTIQTLDTTIGTIDYLTGTNVSYSGIGTIETLDTTTGTIDTLDTTTGTIDYLTGTNISYSGISTLSSVTVGGATTELVVEGDTRITGILTVGSSTVTIDGNNNQITVGTGVTIDSSGIRISGVSSLTATTIYGNFDGELNSLGKTYYVSNTGNDLNSGNNINQPFLTISHALSVATDGDIINVSAGTYSETCPLTVPRGVTLKGSGLRSTTIKPTDATKTNDIFHLNDISTLEDFTITGSYYNSTNDTGYSFAYAPGIAITTRSPYLQRITVLNKGSVVSVTDPYGYDTADSPPTSYIAGRGAKVDGSLVTSNSLEAGMLFNEITFFTPNNTGVILTNGARAEYLNCFHYFASQAIVGVAGSVGIGSTANARVKIVGLSTTLAANSVIKQFNGVGTTIATATVSAYDDPYVTITGKGSGIFTSVGAGSTQDIRIFESDGTTQTGIASRLSFVDYKMFGAEMRSVGCAVEYGTQGVVADGAGVQLRLFATNFNHVGSGKDFTNDDTLVVQADEVVELNSGQVSYVSIDQSGDFRVGDALYINQETGNVSFAATSYNLEVIGNLNVTDGGSNTSTLTPTSLTVGSLELSSNSLTSLNGDININPAGGNETNVDGNLNVSGILTAAVLQTSALQLGDTSIAIDDTGSNGTIRFNTDSIEAMRIDNSQNVAIGTDTATSKLTVDGDLLLTGIGTIPTLNSNAGIIDYVTATNVNVSGASTFVGVSTFQANLFVDGTINSTTAVNVNGVSVIQSAVDEALALAIALG